MTFIYYMSDPVYLSAMSKNAQLKIKIDVSERFSEKFFLQFLSNLCGTFGPHCISCSTNEGITHKLVLMINKFVGNYCVYRVFEQNSTMAGSNCSLTIQ